MGIGDLRPIFTMDQFLTAWLARIGESFDASIELRAHRRIGLAIWDQSSGMLGPNPQVPRFATSLVHEPTCGKLRRHITSEEAAGVVDWLKRHATMVEDPAGPPGVRSADPGDDYLISLAAVAKAPLLSGDDHLLSLRPTLPIHSPAEFLSMLGGEG